MDHRRLFLEHLSTIERITHEVALRNRLPADAAEDFTSLVRLRLIEDECRVLRAFRGQSSMTTYLKTVVTRLLLDFRGQNWGRWRPSERARALGVDALALERLVHRDGYRLSEAAQILQVARRGSLSEADIERLWAQLPVRIPKGTLADSTPIDLLVDPRPAADPVSDSEDAVAASQALARALDTLTPTDRMLLRLHFGRGIPLVHIARMWHLSRATIMRRLGRALRTLRSALQGAGIGGHRLRELVRTGAVELLFFGISETLGENGRLVQDDADRD